MVDGGFFHPAVVLTRYIRVDPFGLQRWRQLRDVCLSSIDTYEVWKEFLRSRLAMFNLNLYRLFKTNSCTTVVVLVVVWVGSLGSCWINFLSVPWKVSPLSAGFIAFLWGNFFLKRCSRRMFYPSVTVDGMADVAVPCTCNSVRWRFSQRECWENSPTLLQLSTVVAYSYLL